MPPASPTDYYAVLSIPHTASNKEINAAFRKLAALWHPDKHHGLPLHFREVAEEKFKQINEAKDVLLDSEKRSALDESLRAASPVRLGLTPSTLDFGHLAAGDSRALRLHVENLGGDPRGALKVELSGGGADNFRVAQVPSESAKYWFDFEITAFTETAMSLRRTAILSITADGSQAAASFAFLEAGAEDKVHSAYTRASSSAPGRTSPSARRTPSTRPRTATSTTVADPLGDIADLALAMLRFTSRNRAAVSSALSILLLAVSTAWSVDWVRTERTYRRARLALSDERWEEARLLIADLDSSDGGYKDAAVMLKESYYRAGSKLLSMQEYARAVSELEELVKVDRHYRSAIPLLKEGYFQIGKQSVAVRDWSNAKAILLKLRELDVNYREGDALLKEAWYALATELLSSQEWISARRELQGLQQMDGSYRDVGLLVKESHYRPAVANLAEGRSDLARIDLEALLSLDATYRDARSLWWAAAGAAEGDCTGLLARMTIHEVPKVLDCPFTADGVVRLFVTRFFNNDLQLLDPMMSPEGQSNASWYCDGSVVNCLARNYREGGFSIVSVDLLRESGGDAKVVATTENENRRVCQTYQLDWHPNRGWEITFFDVPERCATSTAGFGSARSTSPSRFLHGPQM